MPKPKKPKPKPKHKPKPKLKPKSKPKPKPKPRGRSRVFASSVNPVTVLVPYADQCCFPVNESGTPHSICVIAATIFEGTQPTGLTHVKAKVYPSSSVPPMNPPADAVDATSHSTGLWTFSDVPVDPPPAVGASTAYYYYGYGQDSDVVVVWARFANSSTPTTWYPSFPQTFFRKQDYYSYCELYLDGSGSGFSSARSTRSTQRGSQVLPKYWKKIKPGAGTFAGRGYLGQYKLSFKHRGKTQSIALYSTRVRSQDTAKVWKNKDGTFDEIADSILLLARVRLKRKKNGKIDESKTVMEMCVVFRNYKVHDKNGKVVATMDLSFRIDKKEKRLTSKTSSFPASKLDLPEAKHLPVKRHLLPTAVKIKGKRVN